MKVRYLLDENLSPRLKTALARLNAAIDVLRVGDDGAPPLGTRDPEILTVLFNSERILVTANRRTMASHLRDHYHQGGHSHWGILWVRRNSTDNDIANSLHLIWEVTQAEEWMDKSDYIPM